ncbi:PQQ-binding-like beta-propeller repeat protein, partial [Gemmatimonadota bacterium]
RAMEPGLAGDLVAPSASDTVPEVTLKWEFEIGKPGGSDNQAELSAAGDLRFGFRTGDEIWWPMAPAIGADGTIYFGSKDDYLYALNPEGSLRWKYQTGSDVNSPPAVGDDGTIYFGSSDNYLYALNPDGSLKWQYLTGDQVISSPAIAADGTIYVGSSDNYLYALNPDGTLQWRYQTGDAVISSPAIAVDGTIYVGSFDGFLYALNPDSTLRWKFFTYGIVNSSPAIDFDGTIYFGSFDNYAYALKPDGSLKWRYRTEDMITSSPVIDSYETIYFGSLDKHIYAFNPDGSLQWRYFTGGEVWSSPAIGIDGTIYFGSSNEPAYFLCALSPGGGVNWSYQTSDLILSSPAISDDGTIYFGSKDYIFYAVESRWNYGLALSPWPKFNRGPQNTGRAIAGSVLSLPDDQISVNYTPESVGAPFSYDEMATLPGDGTGRLTETPVYLAPRIESNLTLLTNETVTPPLTWYLACNDLGFNGNYYTGNRNVVLQDAAGNALNDSVPFLVEVGCWTSSSWEDIIFKQEMIAEGLNYVLGVFFVSKNLGNFHTQIDLAGYGGAQVGYTDITLVKTIHESSFYGDAVRWIGLVRAGRFEITWVDAGNDSLTVEVYDHVRGVTIPFSAYLDDLNWGFAPPGTDPVVDYIYETGINYWSWPTLFSEIPQSERSTLLVHKIHAGNLEDFNLYVDGQFWNFSSITAMPAPGSVMAVVSAFGYWNGDWNEFYQYPDPVFPGDKWRIDVESQNIIPVEPPEPPVVTLSFNEASAEIGSPFDVKIIMNNPVPVSGGRFFISADPADQVTFCGVNPSPTMTAGWNASIKDTLGSQMIVFYSDYGETVYPVWNNPRHILNLCCTLTESADNKPEISLIPSEAQLADGDNQPVAAILEIGFIFNLNGVGPFTRPPSQPPLKLNDRYSVITQGNNVQLNFNLGLSVLEGFHYFPKGSGNQIPTYEGGWGHNLAVARDKDGDGVKEDTLYGSGRGRSIPGANSSLESYQELEALFNAGEEMHLAARSHDHNRIWSSLNVCDTEDWPPEFREGRTAGGVPILFGAETVACRFGDAFNTGFHLGVPPRGVSFEYRFHFFNFGESANMVYGHLFIRNMSEYLKWNQNPDFVSQVADTPGGQDWNFALCYFAQYFGIGANAISMDEGWAMQPAKGIVAVVDYNGMEEGFTAGGLAFHVGHKMLRHPSFNGQEMVMTAQHCMRWGSEFDGPVGVDLYGNGDPGLVYRASLGELCPDIDLLAGQLYGNQINPITGRPAIGWPGLPRPTDEYYDAWLWGRRGRAQYTTYAEIQDFGPRDSTSCDFALMFVYPANPPMVLKGTEPGNLYDPDVQLHMVPMEEHAAVAQSVYESGYILPEPPPSPLLTLIPGDGQVTLTWSDVNTMTPDPYYSFLQNNSDLDPGGVYREYDFVGYRVYRSTTWRVEDAQLLAEFNQITGLDSSYVDNDVSNGISYYYTVTAFDSNRVQNSQMDTTFSLESRFVFCDFNKAIPGSYSGCALPGDVNQDGAVNVSDLLDILDAVMGNIELSPQALLCADLNRDELINIFDILICVDRILMDGAMLAGSSEPKSSGYSQGELSNLNFEELKKDLAALGADESVIEDIRKLLLEAVGKPSLPKAFSLGQNYPNPFNPTTTINYAVPEGKTVKVTLKVYNLRGRLVATLVDDEREAGNYSVFWSGTDQNGRQVASGVYFYRIHAGEFTQTR